MKKLLYLIALVFLFSYCDKEDDTNTNCKFVGKWCREDPNNAGHCTAVFGTKMEFNSNGQIIRDNNGKSYMEI